MHLLTLGMQTLRTQFPNGPFGDPALYLWDIKDRRAVLFDCGDLTRFTTRQLLKVTHVFMSHCHMDHFFGFDLLLRVHLGEEKTLTIFGPPHTSERVGAKLRGYTWNLTYDHSLEFVVIDLDPERSQKKITHFRVDLAEQIIMEGRPYKIAYATDGATHEQNRKALFELIRGADLFYSETCFVKEDEANAIQTKHFTADFIGQLAKDAQVKRVVPFYFSKRYVDNPDRVLEEVADQFQGEVIAISQEEVRPRF